MISIGIDIGTTTVCAVATDITSGEVAKSTTVENGSFINGCQPFERIQNAELILKKAIGLIDDIINEFGSVCSIGITGQMHGIVYLNAEGKPVSPLYTWQDGRGDLKACDGTTYAEKLAQSTGYSLATGFGSVTHYYNTLNGIVPESAASFCTIHDLLAATLCGLPKPITHTSDAASFGLFNAADCCFDTEAFKQNGMQPELLPAVTDKLEIIGTYKGIPVTVAIGDNQASYIGSVTGENALLVNIGTGSQVSLPSTEYAAPAGCEIRPLYGDKKIAVGSSLCGGRAYAILEKFFRDCVLQLTGQDSGKLYGAMDAIANLPFEGDKLTVNTRFSGTRAEPEKRGSIENIGTDNLTPQALIMGVQQGMTDELLDMYNKMKELSPQKVEIIVGSGNGVRMNPVLRKLICKSFGLPMVMPLQTEEAARGAMLSSLVAAGICRSVTEAQQKFIKYTQAEEF